MNDTIWQIATVTAIQQETPKTKTIRLELPNWAPHLPGQHYNLRLTAPDGYTAMRSYSVATGLNVKGQIELTIDRIPDGEVSEFIHNVLEIGDQIEVRGPIGGYFVWKPTMTKKLLLIGAGSGIVPLMSILRSQPGHIKVKLLYSNQSPDLTIYKQELDDYAIHSWFDLRYTFTRSQPEGWTGYTRRVDREMIMELIEKENPKNCIAYVCGPTAFVEFVANTLHTEGMPPAYIRTERFGPTS